MADVQQIMVKANRQQAMVTAVQNQDQGAEFANQGTAVQVQEASSIWNLRNWFNGGGDSVSATMVGQDSSLLNLPRQIRGIIWRKLAGNDHKSLRLVSKLVNQDIQNDVGLFVKLNSAELSLTGNIFAGFKYLLGYGYQIPYNVQWLQKIRVRKLDIDDLHKIPLFENRLVLKHPASLHTLSICLDEEDGNGARALSIIDQCTSLNRLRISPRVPIGFTPVATRMEEPNWAELDEYNRLTTKILKDTFRILRSKPLKHLELSMKFDYEFVTCLVSNVSNLQNDMLKNFYIGMPLTQVLDRHDIFPTGLDSLEIRMPQIRNVKFPYGGNQVQLFKSLMDAQTKLSHLKVQLGPIYWQYFEVVLRDCFHSLSSLEIEVGNWKDAASIPPNPEPELIQALQPLSPVFSHAPYIVSYPWQTQNVEIPEADLFDWTQLFTANCQLETLSIRMPFRAHLTANRTKNFCLTFDHMKKLELYYVKLNQEEFRKILQDLPLLKDVSITEWYPLLDSHPEANFLAYKQLSDHTFESIRGALALERLDTISLHGELVNGRIYKDPWCIRNAIQHPTYTLKWCEKNNDLPCSALFIGKSKLGLRVPCTAVDVYRGTFPVKYLFLRLILREVLKYIWSSSLLQCYINPFRPMICASTCAVGRLQGTHQISKTSTVCSKMADENVKTT